MAQVYSLAADTATAVRPEPRSIAVVEGALRPLAVLAPSPNCPRYSSPQHFRSPLSRMAQVCCSPAATVTACKMNRNQSLWMKVQWLRRCFHHLPTFRNYPIPNTSCRRCQGFIQQKQQRPFGPSRGQ